MLYFLIGLPHKYSHFGVVLIIFVYQLTNSQLCFWVYFFLVLHYIWFYFDYFEFILEFSFCIVSICNLLKQYINKQPVYCQYCFFFFVIIWEHYWHYYQFIWHICTRYFRNGITVSSSFRQGCPLEEKDGILDTCYGRCCRKGTGYRGASMHWGGIEEGQD